MIITLNSLLGKLLISTSHSSFGVSSASSFCLIFCVYLFVFDILVILPNLEEMAFMLELSYGAQSTHPLNYML